MNPEETRTTTSVAWAPRRCTEEPTAPTPLVSTLLIGLVCLIWGSTWIVIAGGLADLPPFTSAAARFVIAAAAMTALARVLRRREGGDKPPLWLSATLGTCNFGWSYAVVYWSETKLPSALVSVLWSVFPMLMAISGHLFLPGERLRGRSWFGFAIGFLGVTLLFATDLRGLGPEAIPAGIVLLSSPIVSTVGTTLLKRRGAGVSSVLVNRNGMWIGAAILATLAALFERDAPARWTAPAIASVLYLALMGTVVTFTAYFWLLRHTPAHELSLVSYATPAIALLLGGLVGREPITAWTLSGSALIFAGVVLVVGGRFRKRLAGQGVARPGEAGSPVD